MKNKEHSNELCPFAIGGVAKKTRFGSAQEGRDVRYSRTPDTVCFRVNDTDHFEGGKAGLLVFYIDAIRPI